MLPPDYLSALRVDRRRDWRSMVDSTVSKFETSQDARLLDSTFHQAYTLMTSEKAREAFDLHREDDDTRNRYGRNRFGQSCLLARRLVESGVRFVTVNMFETVFDEITWDIHGSPPFSPISGYRDLVGPMFDNGFTSLIEDLSNRGMLDTTMVLALGEFGRTPKVNPAGGRDHWPQAWTVVGSGWRNPGRAGHRLDRQDRRSSQGSPGASSGDRGHHLPSAGDPPGDRIAGRQRQAAAGGGSGCGAGSRTVLVGRRPGRLPRDARSMTDSKRGIDSFQ